MSDENTEKAKQEARRARGEAKAAARDTGRAVKHSAEAAADAVADEARDVAYKAEATAEDAVRTVQALDKLALAKGGLGLAVSVAAGAFSLQQFRQAFGRTSIG